MFSQRVLFRWYPQNNWYGRCKSPSLNVSFILILPLAATAHCSSALIDYYGLRQVNTQSRETAAVVLYVAALPERSSSNYPREDVFPAS